MTEIIDAHVSLVLPGERLSDDESLWPTFESRLEVLREAGVRQALVSRWERSEAPTNSDLRRLNRQIIEVCRATDGLLIPAAIVDPALGRRAGDVLAYCRNDLDMRFVGEIRYAPGRERGAAGFWRVLEQATALRMVPVVRCPQTAVAEIGERCPSGMILIAEFVLWDDDWAAQLTPYPNLYSLFSGCRLTQTAYGAAQSATRTYGAARMVFGSGLGGMDPVIAVECIRRSRLSDEEQAMVFGASFRTLWQWTEEAA
jgi:predicted TIM-barrel fold metal-dependent hydrolase